MAKYIFEELEPVHGLDPALKKVLMPACLLHDIGHFVAEDSHHKHTLYILRNTKFKFLTERETLMMACVARYHRKSQPKESHEIYGALNPADRKIVTGLASILRLADALDAPHDQGVKWVKCQWGPGKVHLKCEIRPGGKLDQEVIKDKARLFEETYNVKVQVVG